MNWQRAQQASLSLQGIVNSCRAAARQQVTNPSQLFRAKRVAPASAPIVSTDYYQVDSLHSRNKSINFGFAVQIRQFANASTLESVNLVGKSPASPNKWVQILKPSRPLEPPTHVQFLVSNAPASDQADSGHESFLPPKHQETALELPR